MSTLEALRHELTVHQEEKRAQLLAMDEVVACTDEVARAQAHATRETLMLVEAALARMDAGSYGCCVHCGSAIPAARLEIVPYADSCVPCRALKVAS